MPDRASVDAFTAHVLSGDHVGAIRDWYAEDAWMRENMGPPRVGREALMAHEAAALARVERVDTELLASPAVAGDTVAIRWRFTIVTKDGPGPSFEEVAWQTWRGNKIAEETFFYDPAQMRAARNAG
jgi:ketosteroid isomerase-like protein